MGHDEKHNPCEYKERETVKTENGFKRICKKCGHTFKEIKTQPTLEQDLF